jgi:hypothetical protein
MLQEFRGHLAQAGVAGDVEFHRCTSQNLAANWDRPIRVLWIDGDHSAAAVRRDLEMYLPHVEKGGIVAFHDVLHWQPGPLQWFAEAVLVEASFGAAGLCGSIGWAQVGTAATGAEQRQKPRLRRRLRVLQRAMAFSRRWPWLGRRCWKLLRLCTPHGAVRPERFARLAAAGRVAESADGAPVAESRAVGP